MVQIKKIEPMDVRVPGKPRPSEAIPSAAQNLLNVTTQAFAAREKAVATNQLVIAETHLTEATSNAFANSIRDNNPDNYVERHHADWLVAAGDFSEGIQNPAARQRFNLSVQKQSEQLRQKFAVRQYELEKIRSRVSMDKYISSQVASWAMEDDPALLQSGYDAARTILGDDPLVQADHYSSLQLAHRLDSNFAKNAKRITEDLKLTREELVKAQLEVTASMISEQGLDIETAFANRLTGEAMLDASPFDEDKNVKMTAEWYARTAKLYYKHAINDLADPNIPIETTVGLLAQADMGEEGVKDSEGWPLFKFLKGEDRLSLESQWDTAMRLRKKADDKLNNATGRDLWAEAVSQHAAAEAGMIDEAGNLILPPSPEQLHAIAEWNEKTRTYTPSNMQSMLRFFDKDSGSGTTSSAEANDLRRQGRQLILKGILTGKDHRGKALEWHTSSDWIPLALQYGLETADISALEAEMGKSYLRIMTPEETTQLSQRVETVEKMILRGDRKPQMASALMGSPDPFAQERMLRAGRFVESVGPFMQKWANQNPETRPLFSTLMGKGVESLYRQLVLDPPGFDEGHLFRARESQLEVRVRIARTDMEERGLAVEAGYLRGARSVAEDLTEYGFRHDDNPSAGYTSVKGFGFQGPVRVSPGSVMTEQGSSFPADETFGGNWSGQRLDGDPGQVYIPMIVPGTTEEELVEISNGNASQSAKDKARAHARRRIEIGLSPFYLDGEPRPGVGENPKGAVFKNRHAEWVAKVGEGLSAPYFRYYRDGGS